MLPVLSLAQETPIEKDLYGYLRKAKQSLAHNPEQSLVYIDSLEKRGSESFLKNRKASISLLKSRANIKMGRLIKAQSFLKELELELLFHQNELLKANTKYQELKLRSSQNLISLFTLFLIKATILSLLLRKQYLAKKRANRVMERQYDQIMSKNRIIQGKNEEIETHLDSLKEAKATIEVQNRSLKKHNEQLECMVEERSNELISVMKRLSIHVDNTPLAFLELDMEGRLTRWPRQAKDLFGWEENEVLGKRFDEISLMQREDHLLLEESLNKLDKNAQPRFFLKNKNFNKKNEVLHIEWSNTLLYDDEDNPETLLCIANNVSSREQALSSLQQSNLELDNFIYKASHDLQGPIARMKGVINLGILEGKDDISRRYFEMLNNVTCEMSQLLTKLQKAHEVFDCSPELKTFNLRSFIESRINEITVSNRNLNLISEIQVEETTNWQGDIFLFQTVIDNLLENAIAHRNSYSPKVSIKAQLINEGILKIIFSDNGKGIVAGTEGRIFDMFYHTSSDTLSDGMGLYLVKKAMEKLGGNIRLVHPKNDTVFEIILPAY